MGRLPRSPCAGLTVHLCLGCNFGWMRVIKAWRWALGLVGLAGAAVVGVAGWNAWSAEQARRHPEAARIARYEKIFDVAWNTVDDKYYDTKFDHARWRSLRDVYRPRARDAQVDAQFYIDVLTNMMNQAGTSHVFVTPPPAPGPVVAAVPAPTPATIPGSPTCSGEMGFDFAEMRRGDRTLLRVSDVRRGSSAEQAGVAPDDLIESLTMGASGGGCLNAELRLRAEGQAARALAFSYGNGPPPPARQRIDLPSGLRVLRFDHFDEASLDWLGGNLPNGAARGLILDLRRNNGGDLQVARRIAGQFLERGAPIARMIRRGREHDETAASGKRRFDGPLVVLIGPASASAAEVTAAALRDHRRALLVGGESAGAVLLSQAYPLPDGGKVTVAIADVLTPDGRRLEGVGVSPDLPVAQTLAAVRAGRDLPLEAAEKALLDGRWRP